MKFRLLAISSIFLYGFAYGMPPSLFQVTPQSIVQTPYSAQIRYRKLRHITPNTRVYIKEQEARDLAQSYFMGRNPVPMELARKPKPIYNPQLASTQVRYKKLRRLSVNTRKYICKQDVNPINALNLENQIMEPEEYFHKIPGQQQNNQDLINLNQPIAIPNFAQVNPLGRELSQQPNVNENSQFVMQKRSHEMLQLPNTPIQKRISELPQPQNTPTESKPNEKIFDDFFLTELNKFFSFEGVMMEEAKNQSEMSSSTIDTLITEQSEEPKSMEGDYSTTVLFRKKSSEERTLDPIFSKYEKDKNLGEFIDRLRKSLPLNLFRKKSNYIRKTLQILETDDITGIYSAEFLKSFLSKKYTSRYDLGDINVFTRIVKNMGYHDLVRAYNLYPLIILEPINGTDIVSALRPILFSGKQSKIEFLEKYYNQAIENLNQGKLPEKAVEQLITRD